MNPLMNPKTRSVYSLPAPQGKWLRQQLVSGLMIVNEARQQLQFWAWELEKTPGPDGWVARTNYERL